MRAILFIVIAFLSFSCADAGKTSENDKKKEPAKTYKQLVEDHLSINPARSKSFLNFTFGATKNETKKQIEALIKAGKIEDRSSITYELINAKVEGWPYDLYITENKSISTLFDVTYYGNKQEKTWKKHLLANGIREEK